PASGSRSGRPRCTDEAADTAIAFIAHLDKFTSPRQIRRKLQFDDISRCWVAQEHCLSVLESCCCITERKRQLPPPRGRRQNKQMDACLTSHARCLRAWLCPLLLNTPPQWQSVSEKRGASDVLECSRI